MLKLRTVVCDTCFEIRMAWLRQGDVLPCKCGGTCYTTDTEEESDAVAE